MQIKVKQFWFNIRSSLWFLPTIMALTAAALAFGLIQLDEGINYKKIPINWFLYSGQREGARSVLSTIASSMVTISGVTFSITLVALTMASSQFGPRLLRNFTADKGNQMVIGTFISTFVYSLIVLLTIHGTGDNEFIPKISLAFAFLLAVFSLGVIIYFIHHVATSIQADYVIKSSYQEFKKVAGHYLSDEKQNTNEPAAEEAIAKARIEHLHTLPVYFESSGFVQSIDYEGICTWAQQHAAVVQLCVHPNNFATIHERFACIYANNPLSADAAKDIRSNVVLGYQRTPNQDILFSIRQIVEVGVRALSPGVNDPNTAITCIHWLGAALSNIATKYFPAIVERDENGVIRLIKKGITYAEIVDTCFDQLMLYSKSNIYVTGEILNAIKTAILLVTNDELREQLQQKATIIYHEMHDAHKQHKILEAIDRHYRDIMNMYSKAEAIS